MSTSLPRLSPSPVVATHRVAALYAAVRADSLRLCAPLSPEDCGAQSMPDASPAKWHLAHTTWFFETFLLKPSCSGYAEFDPAFGYLFNSYYDALGARHPRPQRGLLTRPSQGEVLAYRRHVDRSMQDWLDAAAPTAEVAALVELGLNHERQHQELLLTDVKHLLSHNALQPAYRTDLAALSTAPVTPQRFIGFAEGLNEIGATAEVGFTFDNELPRHRHWALPFAIADRPVNNAEYRGFVEDGGYHQPHLWLADGWAQVQQQGWQRPLYWNEDLASHFSLAGTEALVDAATVAHLSYYEADAYARWSGARLPTEQEWEIAAADEPVTGNFVEADRLRPDAPAAGHGLRQCFGDVWEWTGSAYRPYPGFRTSAGAVGEYNGKFMNNQMVLRGGSCASAADHLRASYRNFFPPEARWQFAGLRLAKDC